MDQRKTLNRNFLLVRQSLPRYNIKVTKEKIDQLNFTKIKNFVLQRIPSEK